MTNKQLTPDAKSKASKAIQAMHKMCLGKDGLIALSTRLDKKRESCAVHIYSLAQFAIGKCPRLAEAEKLFAEMCHYAEEELKAKLEVTNLRDALPPWASYKSCIRRGMNLGLNPAKFDTEGEFRLAMLAKANPDVNSDAPRELTATNVERFLTDDTTIAKGLHVRLQRMMLEAQYLMKGKVGEAEAILQEASEKLAALLDHRKLAKVDDTATREFLVPTSNGSAEVAATLQ